jgi:hypothetical protein
MALGCYKSGDDHFFQGKCKTTGKHATEYNDSKWIEYDSRPAMNLNYWKSRIFCLKYSTYPLYTSTSTCQPGYLLCSPNLCYLSSEGCPITYINVSSVNYAPQANTTQSSSIDGNLNLYYRKDVGQNPIVSLAASFGGTACLDNGMTSNSNQSPYVLSTDQSSHCEQFGTHPQSSIVDFDVEFNWYNYNMMQWILGYYRGYGLYTQTRTAFLVSKSKLPLNSITVCQNTDFGELLSIGTTLSNFQAFATDFVAIVLIVFSCFVPLTVLGVM